MDEKEMLEVDIGDLRNAYEKIQEALNDLRDVENFTEEQYHQLFDIAEDINDLRIEKENELETLEEIEDEDIPNLERDLEIADKIYQDNLDREWGIA